jgi:hypothetical protein
LRDAAAEFRALQIENVTQYPQQGHIGRDIHSNRFSVDFESHSHGVFTSSQPPSNNVLRRSSTVEGASKIAGQDDG